MGKIISQLCLLIAYIALLSGCVTTNATLLGTSGFHSTVFPNAGAIYLTADRVPGRDEEIALLHSQGPAEFTREPQRYESMKEKAASLGAHAIMLDAISDPSAGAKIAAAVFGTSAERKGKAIAIDVFPPTQGPPVMAPQPAGVQSQVQGGP